MIDGVVGIVTFVLEYHGRDIVALIDGEAGRDTVLTHSVDLD